MGKRWVPYSAYKLNDAVVDSLIKALLKLEEVRDIANTLILPLTPLALAYYWSADEYDEEAAWYVPYTISSR